MLDELSRPWFGFGERIEKSRANCVADLQVQRLHILLLQSIMFLSSSLA